MPSREKPYPKDAQEHDEKMAVPSIFPDIFPGIYLP